MLAVLDAKGIQIQTVRNKELGRRYDSPKKRSLPGSLFKKYDECITSFR